MNVFVVCLSGETQTEETLLKGPSRRKQTVTVPTENEPQYKPSHLHIYYYAHIHTTHTHTLNNFSQFNSSPDFAVVSLASIKSTGLPVSVPQLCGDTTMKPKLHFTCNTKPFWVPVRISHGCINMVAGQGDVTTSHLERNEQKNVKSCQCKHSSI